MVSCAACGRSQCIENREEGISYHCFPDNVKRRELWSNFVNKDDWKPSKRSFLCSLHFEDESFDRTVTDVTRLKETAIPTLTTSCLKYEHETVDYPDVQPVPVSLIYIDKATEQQVTPGSVSDESMFPIIKEEPCDFPVKLELNESTPEITVKSTFIPVKVEPSEFILPNSIVQDTNKKDEENSTFEKSSAVSFEGSSEVNLQCDQQLSMDTPKKLMLKRKLTQISSDNMLKTQKIQKLEETVWLQKQRISKLENLIKALKENKALNRNDIEVVFE